MELEILKETILGIQKFADDVTENREERAAIINALLAKVLEKTNAETLRVNLTKKEHEGSRKTSTKKSPQVVDRSHI